MKQLQKLGLSFLMFFLCGCSEAKEYVRPVTEPGTEYMAFNDTGQKMLKEVYGSENLSEIGEGILSVGKAIPDLDLVTYDGLTVNMKDYQGKPMVVELMAYWCDYCRKNVGEFESVISKYPEISFMMAFVEGAKGDQIEEDGILSTSDTIRGFFEETGTDMKEKIIVQESDDLSDYTGTLYLSVFPTFVFFDEQGKISWVYEGYLEADTFKDIQKYAFGDDTEDRLYSHLADEIFSASDYKRTYLDVKADYSEEAQKILLTLDLDPSYGEATYYSNVGKKISSSTRILDLNGEILDMQELSGTTAYFFLSESDENFEENIKVLNIFHKVMAAEPLTTVTVLISDVTGDAAKVYGEQQTKPLGYVLDASKDIPKALYSLLLFHTPTVVFVNETDKMCTGAYYGTFTNEKLQEAYREMAKGLLE